MATVFGEKCVMRVLDKSRSLLQARSARHAADTTRTTDGAISVRHGAVRDPGSGKTTTLYATINEIDERSRNIVTIEDPVEYVFPTINQVQTSEQAGIPSRTA